MRNTLTLLSGAALACGAVMAGATILGVAPWAHAQGSDYVFLTGLHAAHIPGSDDAAIHNAHLTCQWLDQGVSTQQVLLQMTSTGLNESEATVFMVLAAGEYCPQHLAKPTLPPSPKLKQPETRPDPPEYNGDEPFGPHLVSNYRRG